jgi:hypothetical protein
MGRQPGADRWGLLGGQVVTDQVHVEFGRHGLLNLAEELGELDRPVSPLDGVHDQPGGHVQSREQIGGPAAGVVDRVLLRLQGLSSSVVGAQVSLTELLQPYLEEMTLERLNPVSIGRRALRTLRGWERLLATAPTNLRPLLRQLRGGRIGVEFRIHDADSVTDRLVDGILAAASLLASAELIGWRTGPRIGDVSIPGAIALTVGVVTWRRLIANRVGHRSSLSRIRQLVVPPSQGSAAHRSSTP